MRKFVPALLLLALAGCGGPKLHPVHGVVTFDGKPAKGGSVQFTPVGGGSTFTASGLVLMDGRYTVTTTRAGTARPLPGAPAGEYAVTYFPPGKGDEERPEPIRAITIAVVRVGDNDIPITVLKR